MASKHLKIAAVAGALGAGVLLAACGEAKVETSSANPPMVNQGAEIFHERCSGCHTLSAAAAEGSATKVRDRERVDGPNFNQRRETVPQVLYALRNGGFSGAIMPQNLAVGEEAQAVAEFLQKYSGRDAKAPVGPGAQPAPNAGTSSGSG